MKRIRKATDDEKAAYDATKPVYPLFGFVEMDGRECAVEDLRGSGGREDPRLEVMAPAGTHFAGEGTHSLLAISQADLVERVEGEELVPCTERCG